MKQFEHRPREHRPFEFGKDVQVKIKENVNENWTRTKMDVKRDLNSLI